MNLDQKIEKLAELAVKIGVNVKEGDTVEIKIPVDRVDLARKLVEQAYKAGAHKVLVDWSDDYSKLLDYTYQTVENLKTIPDHKFNRDETLLKEGVKQIFVKATDPELLKDIDPAKVKEISVALNTKYRPLMNYRMNDITSWTIISAPNDAWAKKVFPNSENPVEDLWEAIFHTTRVNKENPVESWEHNIKLLTTKAKWLNEQNFESLHYEASNGTDLNIGLPEGHIWRAAYTKNKKGEEFVPNIPTEEVYSLADRNRVDGKVYSSKPLAYNGNVIDNFWVEFKDGAVVDFDAEIGKQTFEDLLNSDDDRSRRLGEVALVPFDSPISNSNILFYNTLFDENASCHIALGAAYPTTIKNGTDLSSEELVEKGANQSIVHVDFMIGTKDLNITGIKKDGTEVPIFKEGNWA